MASGRATPVAPGAAWTSPACPSKKITGGLLWLPRRQVLMTAALVCVAASLAGYPGLASGAPAAAPPASCSRGVEVNDQLVRCTDVNPSGKKACPPVSQGPVFDFRPERAVRRVRQAVHRLSRRRQAKYREAVAKMKALPSSHPLSFAAQAAIHEAYCDAHYRFVTASGKDDRVFDVHFSWLFAPWHRMYIYFYERALGELIGDDTFALPYWSWDVQPGMVVPPLFRDSPASNPLYNANRNPAHLDKLLNLNYLEDPNKDNLIDFGGPQDRNYTVAVETNRCIVFEQQIRCAKTPRAFLGDKLCSPSARQNGSKMDENDKAPGSLERMAHTTMHVWVGKPGPKDKKDCKPQNNNGVPANVGEYVCTNDMGFLGAAGRDPLFYSHHSNVDRMWHLWSTRLGGRGFRDREWLDAAFVFYDGVRNTRRVRIRVRDVLDTRNLGYTYADAEPGRPLPWLSCKQTPLVPHGNGSSSRPGPSAGPVFPLTLKQGKPVEVPAVALPAAQPGQQRVLLIQGIEYDATAENKFDVAINVPKESAANVGPQNVEYAGSFSVVPNSKGEVEGMVALYIEGVLDDIGAARDATVDVVIIPRTERKIRLMFPPTIENQD